MNLNWFLSRKVRHADQMAKHVRKILNAQRDILSFEAIQNVQKSLQELEAKMKDLETVANAWLKSYPHPAFRENIEVLLVAIAVAMAIRTFFLQPFKIPTGSMQPTLFGVTQEDLRGRDDGKIPGFPASFFEYWFNGVQYFHIVAKSSGTVSYD